MEPIILNDKLLEVDERLTEFTIHKKPSSNVDFFGVNAAGGKFFIQFQNGTSYIFTEVETDTLNGAVNAESIGKYFNSRIARKNPSSKLEMRLVKEVSNV